MATKKTPSKKTKTDDTDSTDDTVEDQETDADEDTDEDPAEENRRINAIVTSRVKREMKGVMSALQAMQETMKTLAAPKKTEDEDADEDQETDIKKKSAVDPKLDKKLTKLERELADERAARKAAEDNQKAEAAKSQRAEMRNIYDSALAEAGVTDPKLRRAALNVLEEDGIMIRDEDGKIKYKGVDKYGIDTNFDPKVGLKTWVAGDGKSFIPAVDAGGSGTGGTNRSAGGTGVGLTPREVSKMSPAQRASINLERACSGLPPLPETEG